MPQMSPMNWLFILLLLFMFLFMTFQSFNKSFIENKKSSNMSKSENTMKW